MLNLDILTQLVEGSGLSYKRNSRSWILTCPRCNKPGKLFIERKNGRFICFVCAETQNFKGRPEYALSELLSIPVAILRSQLYGESQFVSDVFFDIEIRDFFGRDDVMDDDADEIPTVSWAYNHYPLDHHFAVRGVHYLQSRGIPLEIAKEYNIRHAPEDRRVMFPIEMDGRLIGHQGRFISQSRVWSEDDGRYYDTPKILTSKGVPRDRVVMFMDRLKGSKHVVLCEGPVDALKAHLCGGNVATMGKAVTKGQIALIRSLGVEKIYLALDPDAADETQRLVRAFSDLEVYLMHPPEGKKDLGEMSMEEVKELFLAAPRVNPAHVFVFIRKTLEPRAE